MTNLLNSAADTRRRTCVVCATATPHYYVTSFTRVAEKQEEWIGMLANGDVEFGDELRRKLSTGRKYMCLDHFDRHQMTVRKNGDGIEIVRNSVPIPYKNTEFVRNRHKDFRIAVAAIANRANNQPAPSRKPTHGLEGKGAELTAESMAFLMSTANFYVEKAMSRVNSEGTEDSK